jgi:FkbM family methyltransferase
MEDKTLDALYALVSSELSHGKQLAHLLRGQKLFLMPAGRVARQCYKRLIEKDIDIEFFVDNDTAMDGTTFCGKPVVANPWATVFNFSKDYIGLIATSKEYYDQISAQLQTQAVQHFPCYSVAYCDMFPKIAQVCERLEDTESKLSYLGAIYDFITYDSRFVYCNYNRFFGVKQFFTTSTPSKPEIIVDASAFVGDELDDFVRMAFCFCKIYAFEPMKKTYDALCIRSKRIITENALDIDAIVPVNAAISDATGQRDFYECSNRPCASAVTPVKGAAKTKIQTYSLDDYFTDKEPPTLIKSDMEGHELAMLKGARRLLKSNKPKLCVSIFYSFTDFVDVPLYVMSIVPEYHFAVRNHSMNYEDAMLYCYIAI